MGVLREKADLYKSTKIRSSRRLRKARRKIPVRIECIETPGKLPKPEVLAVVAAKRALSGNAIKRRLFFSKEETMPRLQGPNVR